MPYMEESLYNIGVVRTCIGLRRECCVAVSGMCVPNAFAFRPNLPSLNCRPVEARVGDGYCLNSSQNPCLWN